jgi:fatty acid desaturase
MFSDFTKNNRFLNQYYLTVIAAMIFAIAGVAYFRDPDLYSFLLFSPTFLLFAFPNFYLALLAFAYVAVVASLRVDFMPYYLLGVPVAVLITFPATTLLHNASHPSFKPQWLRRVVGELMGVWQLAGFPDWTVVHVLHHKHSDDPLLDPHPPLDKTYWEFMLNLRESVSKVLGAYYFSLFGNTPDSVKNLKELGVEAKIATALKAIFWFVLLGPQWFAFFFAASIPFKMLHYAWFNYATHIMTPDGVAIVNLDQGIYRFINAISFGLYFHKNHHSRPDLFNPSKL